MTRGSRLASGAAHRWARWRLGPPAWIRARLRTWLPALILGLFCLLSAALPLAAAPVEWREVAPTPDGRQWWDAGSLRLNRSDHLTVLSRFQPASQDSSQDSSQGARQGSGGLYVMELDCDQNLYRDTSINGIPRWRAEWQPGGEDDLTAEVIRAVCAAGEGLTSSSRP